MPARYDVYTSLAGNSATRTWRKSYVSLAAAQRYANSISGYGIIGIVVPR